MRRPGLRWPTRERSRKRLRQLIWSVVLVAVGLVVGLAAGAPFASSPLGQATVLVRPLPGNAFSARSTATNTLVDLKTEAQLAFSDAVLGKVQPFAGKNIDAAGLRRRVSVGVVNNAEVIVFSYRGDTSLQATAMATHVAQAFLAVRSANAAKAAEARTAVVQVALDKTQHDFDTASQSGNDPAVLTVLGQRITSLRVDLRAVGGTPPSAGSILAASAPRSAKVRVVRVGLLVTSALLAGFIGIRLGRRQRHLPRWTHRLRPRRPRHLPRWSRRLRFRRRLSLHGSRQARAR